MATFTSEAAVDEIMAMDGSPGRPPVLAILEYRTPEGQRCWAVCFTAAEVHATLMSPFVVEAFVIFVAEGVLH